MVEITENFLDYRNSIIEIWNKHFIDGQTLKEEFRFEVDKAFSLIDEGLFISLVLAKVFDYSFDRENGGYYSRIVIIPKLKNASAFNAKAEGRIWNWKDINFPIENSTFNYIEFFDWDIEGKTRGEFVRTRLTKSATFPQLVGHDFLFNALEVDYFKIED